MCCTSFPLSIFFLSHGYHGLQIRQSSCDFTDVVAFGKFDIGYEREILRTMLFSREEQLSEKERRDLNNRLKGSYFLRDSPFFFCILVIHTMKPFFLAPLIILQLVPCHLVLIRVSPAFTIIYITSHHITQLNSFFFLHETKYRILSWQDLLLFKFQRKKKNVSREKYEDEKNKKKKQKKEQKTRTKTKTKIENENKNNIKIIKLWFVCKLL